MVVTATHRDLEELHRQLEKAMDQLIQGQFSQFRTSDHWTPSINAYRVGDRIEVCVELAGVVRESIDIRAEPGQSGLPGVLIVRGYRQSPNPEHKSGDDVRILAMEIDHGPFERRFELPRQVAVNKIKAEQRNGMLWIKLPLGHG